MTPEEMLERAAEALFAEFCPGYSFTNEADRVYYIAGATAALTASGAMEMASVASAYEAALRGVHGIEFPDGYSVNVAALREEAEDRAVELGKEIELREAQADHYEVLGVQLQEAWKSKEAQVASLLSRIERLEGALRAAAQFLEPEIRRGPAADGWQNTMDAVEGALAHAESGEEEGKA